MEFDLRSNINEVMQGLNQYRDQIPFATANAMNKTAEQVVAAEYEEMKKVFDRPTRFTLNSIYFKRTSKRDAEKVITIKIKDEAGKGTPAEKYLLPEVIGGQRRHKGSELALTGAGLIPQGSYMTPGSAARIDAYGNMSRGQITQMLSQLSVQRTGGYTSTISARSRRRATSRAGGSFFVGRPGGKPLGVWQRYGGKKSKKVKPIYIAVRPPNYRKRLKFQEVGEKIINENFKNNFIEAMSNAVRTRL